MMKRHLRRILLPRSPQSFNVLMFMVGCLFLAIPCLSQNSLNKHQIEKRLGYLESVDHFTASAPLSQAQLMNLLLDLADWGVLPKEYRGTGHLEMADDYITRAMARRFLKELVGQDLQIWKAPDDKIQGDKLGWIYHRSNTTHFPPFVRVLSQKNARRTITVQFQLMDRPENLDGKPFKIGSGAATLENIGGNWVVTSWKVNRLHH